MRHRHRSFPRDEKLNKEEWAVAMHLVVCATARKLPLPDRLPKCLLLRPSSSHQQEPLKETQRRQQRQGETAADSGAEGGKEPVKHQKRTPKEKTQEGKPNPPADLKRATKEFKSGGMEAEDFLLVLQVRGGRAALVLFGKAIQSFALFRCVIWRTSCMYQVQQSHF